MRRPGSIALAFVLGAALASVGCRDLERFDTKPGEAYCGNIVAAPFVRTSERSGGFRQDLRLRLRLDADNLDTTPGSIATDDAADGPCAPEATFDEAVLQAVPEISHDELFLMNFGSGRDHNVLAWAQSSCRGPMLVVVSLMRNDDVEVRLMTPPPQQVNSDPEDEQRPAFALFPLKRRKGECFEASE